MGRILGYLWVAVTAVINVFALSALLSHFGLANNVWGDPFWSLGEAYRALVDNSFAQVAGVFMDNVGPERAWIAHALVAYVATASAIAVVRERGDDGTGRNGLADGLVGGLQDVVLSGAWIATLPVFLLNSVREFRLSRFANDHARAAVVYVFSVLVIYGGARYVNAAFLEPPVDGTVMMLTNARGGGADSEERYSVADCRTLLDRGRARRAGLETAVDRALAKGDVANAEAAAQALSQLMWCESDQLGSFDKARVYFATADSFYRSGEWALARQYYKDGLFSLDYLAQDEDTGVLVNPLTTAGHQLRVIEAWKELFSAGDVRFFEEERGERAGATAARDLAAAIAAVDGLPPDLTDGLLMPYREQLRIDGQALLSQLLEGYFAGLEADAQPSFASMASSTAPADLDNLISLVTSGPWQAPGTGNNDLPYAFDVLANMEGRLVRLANAATDESALRFSPYDEMIYAVRAEMLAQLIDAGLFRFGDPLSAEDKAGALKLATGMTDYLTQNIYSQTISFDEQSANGFANPYLVAAGIYWRAGAGQKAIEILVDGIVYMVWRYEDPSLLRASLAFYVQSQSAEEFSGVASEESLAFALQSDMISFAPLRDELTTLYCSNDLRRFSPVLGCRDYIRALLDLALADIEDVFDVAPEAAAYFDSLGETVFVDLLFGTTREFVPSSLSPEEVFRTDEDPEGRGWRGKLTLSAPLALLGPPLLADAFEKGAERKDFFSFLYAPDVFGFDDAAHDRFVDELRTVLANAENDEVLIYVHGVANSFADAAKRTAQISYDLSFEGTSMFYSWPTESSFLFYRRDVDIPPEAITDFARFVNEAASEAGKVHIIAHSHGARVTVLGLKQARADAEAAGRTLDLGQVIFAAPDVDVEEMEREIKNNIGDLAERVTIYANKSDGALIVSSVLRFFRNRIGRINASAELLCEADLIDASDAVPFGAHGYFAKEPEVVADIRTMFWHTSLQPEDRCYMEAAGDKSSLAWRLNGEKCDVTAYDIASIAAFEKPEGMDDLAFADLFISFDKRGLRYVPGDTPAEDRWSYYDQQTYQYLEIDLRQDAKFLAARAAYDFIVDARQRPAAARCDGL